MTTIDEAFEEVRVTLNYLDQFRTLVPMSEDRDDALYALNLIRKRIEELEGALRYIEQPTLAGGAAQAVATCRRIAAAALSTPSRESVE